MTKEAFDLIDRRGINHFGAVAGKLGYLFNKINDLNLAIDGELELTQGVGKKEEKIGVKILPESRFEKSEDGYISIKVTDKVLSDWRNYKHPVILATCFVQNEEIYWTRVDYAVGTAIKISTENKFDEKASKELLRILFSYYLDFGLNVEAAPFSEVVLEFGHGAEGCLDPLEDAYTEAQASMKSGDYDGARIIYQAMSIIFKKIKVFRLNYAISLYYSGEFEECIKLCIDLIQEYKHNPRLQSLISNCYAKIGDLELAQKYLEKAVELMPLSVELWNGIGLLQLGQGEYEKAQNAFKVALRYVPNNEAVYFNMALCNSLLGKNNEALEFYDKCISIKHDYYHAYNNKALILKAMWRLGEAINCFEKAIDVNPDSYYAIFNLACLLKGMGEHERAITYFNRCIELGKDAEKINYDLACLHCAINNLDKAALYFDKSYNFVKYDVDREDAMGTVQIIDSEYEALRLIKIEFTPQDAKVIEVSHDKKLTFFNMNSFMKESLKILKDKK